LAVTIDAEALGGSNEASMTMAPLDRRGTKKFARTVGGRRKTEIRGEGIPLIPVVMSRRAGRRSRTGSGIHNQMENTLGERKETQ